MEGKGATQDGRTRQWAIPTAWIGAVMLMSIGIGFAALAQTLGPTLIVVNEDPNGDAVHSVYVWHEDAAGRGPNRLASVLINRDPPWLFLGESVEIALHGGGMRHRCQFNILIEDTDGDWTEYDADLCQTDYVVFP